MCTGLTGKRYIEERSRGGYCPGHVHEPLAHGMCTAYTTGRGHSDRVLHGWRTMALRCAACDACGHVPRLHLDQPISLLHCDHTAIVACNRPRQIFGLQSGAILGFVHMVGVLVGWSAVSLLSVCVFTWYLRQPACSGLWTIVLVQHCSHACTASRERQRRSRSPPTSDHMPALHTTGHCSLLSKVR